MTRKLGLTFIATVIAGSLLLLAPLLSWGANDRAAKDAAQTVRRMEAHWQTLVRETDPARRKELIAEHRKIMAETRAKLDAAPTAPTGQHGHQGMSEMHHHHDIQNTMELHTQMLEMMQ